MTDEKVININLLYIKKVLKKFNLYRGKKENVCTYIFLKYLKYSMQISNFNLVINKSINHPK